MGYSNYIGIGNVTKETTCLDLIGIKGFVDPQDQFQVLANFSNIQQKIEELAIGEHTKKYSSNYKKYLQEILVDFRNFANKKKRELYEEFASMYYSNPFSYVLTFEDPIELRGKFDKFLKNKLDTLPENFRIVLAADFEYQLQNFNKRYSFDDAALIRLIETGRRMNIRSFESWGRPRRGENLILGDDGSFYLGGRRGITQYTNGGNIPQGSDTANSGGVYGEYHVDPSITQQSFDVLEKSGTITISDKIEESDKLSEMMKVFLKVIIETVEVCDVLFKKYYGEESKTEIFTSSRNPDLKRIKIKTQLSNLPHLLGIPKFSELPDGAQAILGRGGSYSSASDTLKLLLENRDAIISNGGVYQKRDARGTLRTFTMLPWEKIMLRTNAFLRGDIFKNCLCVALLSSPLAQGSNEIYATITPTDFSNSSTVRGVEKPTDFRRYHDIGKIANGQSDLVFRGLTTGRINSDEKVFSDTIMVGKKENIRPKNAKNTLLYTLDYFREKFADDGPGDGGPGGNGGGPNDPGNSPGGGGSGGSNSPIDLYNKIVNQYGNNFPYWRGPNTPAAVAEFIESGEYLRVFSIYEQMITALTVRRELGLTASVSDDVIYRMEQAKKEGANISDEEIEAFKKLAVLGYTSGMGGKFYSALTTPTNKLDKSTSNKSDTSLEDADEYLKTLANSAESMNSVSNLKETEEEMDSVEKTTTGEYSITVDDEYLIKKKEGKGKHR